MNGRGDGSRSQSSGLAAAALLLASCAAARAQSGTWIRSSSGAWSDPGNWSGGIVADGTNSTADLGAADLAGAVTNRLDTPRTIGRLVLGDATPGTPAAWVVDDGGSADRVLTLAGAAPAVTVTNLASAELRANLALASAGTDLRAAAGNTLALSRNVTSLLPSTAAVRFWGPGAGIVSGQWFKPSEPGYRQVEVKGGVLNFRNARLFATSFALGYFTSANAYVSMTDSSVAIDTAGQWWGRIEIGGSGALTSMALYGGSLSVPDNAISILGYTGQRGRAVLSLDGRARVSAAEIWMGEVDYNYASLVIRDADVAIAGRVQAGGAKGAGVINQYGGSLSAEEGLYLQFRMGQASSWGIYNLHGGTLSTRGILSGDESAACAQNNTYFNFHGGTLQCKEDSSDFIRTTISGVNAAIAAPRALVYAEGAVIDTAGHAVVIRQPLAAPPGSGVSGGRIALPPGQQGSGYRGLPVVEIARGAGDSTGAAATAVAEMADDGTGKGTFKIEAVHIINPGVDYTATPTLTVFGGDPATLAVVPPLAVATNLSGGLTKRGAGTLTLTGANSYTGDTRVVTGTLALEQPRLADRSSVHLEAGATLALNFDDIDTVRCLYYQGSLRPRGLYAPGSLGGAIGGTGFLRVTEGPFPGGACFWVR